MVNKVRVYGKAQNRTALGIMNAYMVMYPQATMEDLEKAFPNELNPDSGVKKNFVVAGDKGTDANWNGFFQKDDELLTMGDGTKVAVVSMWTKPSFERLVSHAAQYGIEIAQFDAAEGGGKKGSFRLEYLNGYVPPAPVAEKKGIPWWVWAIIGVVVAGLVIALLCRPKGETEVVTVTDTVVKTVYVQQLEKIEENFNAAEFQQITTYPETGTEALLRSNIQFLRNIHFIFSGSKQHLMSEMFISPQRPFFQSTDILNLTPIEESTYYHFANNFFESKGGHFDRDVFHELYASFDGYTWYIQSILNRLYESHKAVETPDQLHRAILSVTASKAPQYESLSQFLTANQFAVLKAIARDGIAKEPTGKDFLKRHRLASASSTKTALETLLEKELAYRQADGYIVYDRFLNIWLKRL